MRKDVCSRASKVELYLKMKKWTQPELLPPVKSLAQPQRFTSAPEPVLSRCQGLCSYSHLVINHHVFLSTGPVRISMKHDVIVIETNKHANKRARLFLDCPIAPSFAQLQESPTISFLFQMFLFPRLPSSQFLSHHSRGQAWQGDH